MNLDPAPRVSKTTFLIIDAVLLVTAFLIVSFAKNPYAPLPFVSAVVCVVVAAVIGLVPFLIDYAADSAEYVQQERTKVTDQVQRLNAASESLARAAAQIKAVEEAVHKTAHAAENLPYRMQEKLAEFNQQLAQTEDEEKERLAEELAALRQSESERLQAIADKIHQASAELAALEAAARKQVAAAQEAATGKLETKLNSTLALLDARLAALNAAVATIPATIPVATAPSRTPPAEPVAPETETQPARQPEPAAEPAPAPVPLASAPAPFVESVSVVETAQPAVIADAPAAEEPKPKKPRAPRKPKPEETLAAMSEPPPPAETDASSGESIFPDSPAEAAPARAETPAEPFAKIESAVSADGATRLLVTAYIGIGNKLFIRGDGPGLNWDKGVPMKFVSIGKWGWATDAATGPVSVKLYKNDETPALSGEVSVEPGQHVEVTALF